MKSGVEACFLGLMLIWGGGAQDSKKIVPAVGISLQMPVANHAVEMKAADEPNAKVVAIAADGTVSVGITAAEPSALSNLSEGTVYVKADSRAPCQKLLTVLDALRGKSVVLLTAPPENTVKQGIVASYGMTLTVSQ